MDGRLKCHGVEGLKHHGKKFAEYLPSFPIYHSSFYNSISFVAWFWF